MNMVVHQLVHQCYPMIILLEPKQDSLESKQGLLEYKWDFREALTIL